MITSSSNAKVKEIRKLHDRKYRQVSGLFYLEGLRLIGEAFELGVEIELLVYSPDLLKSDFGNSLLDKAEKKGITKVQVSQDVFKSLALKERPQGIAAVVRQKYSSENSIYEGEKALWIALDSIQDPGNLGTIFRTADACGVEGVILLNQTTDPYDDESVRASMGSIFALKIIKMDFLDFYSLIEKGKIPVIGTSGSAQTDYQTFDYPEKMVLLMGSERLGLQEKHLQICDEVVRIPMIGRADSLNLAVATSVVLYEIFNQRRKRGAR